ncbi:FCD domain-containing protein [Rhodococcus sp. USK10]|uniref:FadR/GntR family transcriptional regulator n=1 Tax=Rhodococcus TaxID=1827 RepID=UPI000F585D25|nr:MULTISPECIES: FCD domain-containing protein [Rhodococcus]MBV6755019.1 FCD domain-containing protein [Rhodococcus opacus]QYB06790.1 FCD domain-containing protein [Rhodococcus sp. USK10]
MNSVEKDVFSVDLGRVRDDSVSKLVDGVVHQLEMTIAVGLLAGGERLPTEAELAGKLQVSTVTLRQALTVLRDRGLIETRRGRGGGSYVRDFGTADRERADAQLRTTSAEKLRDLGDLVGALTGAATRLAALRALPEDVDRLEDLARNFAEATRADVRRRADSRFHIELGAAAQSSHLTTLIVQAQAQVAPLLWDTDALDPHDAIREHALIVEAIRDRDPDAAHRHALEHCARETRVLVDRHLALAAT